MGFAFRPLRKGHWSSGDDVSEQGGEVFCRAKTASLNRSTAMLVPQVLGKLKIVFSCCS